ncbi:hypothetical protein KHQ81_09065 [Mycoplasmatota bacterium]|nr:hypothetical protein KHQ81_09065 [Mycoplasmatota bacterium]
MKKYFLYIIGYIIFSLIVIIKGCFIGLLLILFPVIFEITKKCNKENKKFVHYCTLGIMMVFLFNLIIKYSILHQYTNYLFIGLLFILLVMNIVTDRELKNGRMHFFQLTTFIACILTYLYHVFLQKDVYFLEFSILCSLYIVYYTFISSNKSDSELYVIKINELLKSYSVSSGVKLYSTYSTYKYYIIHALIVISLIISITQGCYFISIILFQFCLIIYTYMFCQDFVLLLKFNELLFMYKNKKLTKVNPLDWTYTKVGL